MISQKILQYFPPPAYLDTPYAGLAMSDAHIRVIQFVSAGNGEWKIKTYAELPLPAGAITAGRVNNPDQIVAVLKQLKEQTGIKYVRVSIPEEKAYLFETEIPEVDAKQVKSTLELKIEENVPLPLDQIMFDYCLLSPTHAVVSALPVKFVTIYMSLFHDAGLIPYVLEIESQAIARALIRPGDAGTYLIMHVSRGKIAMCVVSERVVHFTSTLNPVDTWQTEPGDIISEISKVVLYWHNNHSGTREGKKSIEKIFLSGDIVSTSVTTALSASLKIDVVMGNVWVNAFDVNATVPTISFAESLQYTAAVGLALPAESLI